MTQKFTDIKITRYDEANNAFDEYHTIPVHDIPELDLLEFEKLMARLAGVDPKGVLNGN